MQFPDLTYWMLKGETHTAIFVFTAVLIVACPCALALSIPFTFGNTMRIFGKAGLYIKNTEVIEKLSHISTIVFDKTGTLTKPNENKILYTGRALSQPEINAVYSLAKQSTHPLSTAISQHYNSAQYITLLNILLKFRDVGFLEKSNNLEIKIGSEEYVTNQQNSNSHKASVVYLSIK